MKEVHSQRIPPHLAPQKGEITLFSNRLLERLSRISPITVLAVYLPLVALAIWKSFDVAISLSVFAALFASGVVFWTLFEYFFHRYVFHFFPEGKFQERVQFLFHGVHHQYPNDKDRLVMPVTLSLITAALLFALFYAILGTFVWAFFAGFLLGYLAYDMTHYCIHHARAPKSPYLKKLWKHHMDHHYRDTNRAYGVSSAAWDFVFSSMQKQKTSNE